MRFFSWLTKEGNSISNVFSSRGTFKVYMHSPDGRIWEESKYEGYGVFGGKDYFELMAELNGKKTRSDGIDLYYADDKTDLIYPILSEKKKWDGNFKNRNQDCTDQGYFYSDENSDENNSEENNDNNEDVTEGVILVPLEVAKKTETEIINMINNNEYHKLVIWIYNTPSFSTGTENMTDKQYTYFAKLGRVNK